MGNLTADEIKATIHGLVDDGFYLNDFLDALEISRPRLDEVLPGLQAAFRYHGIIVPDKEQAVWILIEHHLKVIAAGALEPWQELCQLMADVYWDYDFDTPTKEYVGDSHGIACLLRLFWSIDDLSENSEAVSLNGRNGEDAWAELNRQIIIEAERWLASERPSI